VNILVFGAGGATGRRLVDQAMERGHRVTAFVRTLATWPSEASGLTVVRGDVRDADAVDAAVEGQDVVVCALGAATPLRRDPALVEGIRNIVTAMHRHGVRRLVYLSFLGVHDGRPQLSALGRWVVAPLLMRNVVADHETKERITRASSLDWVIVRPPRLTNAERRGTFREGVGIRASGIVPRIARADLADFMLRQIGDDTYLRQAPAVMY
jgi:putative NADH-flavin reductase